METVGTTEKEPKQPVAVAKCVIGYRRRREVLKYLHWRGVDTAYATTMYTMTGAGARTLMVPAHVLH